MTLAPNLLKQQKAMKLFSIEFRAEKLDFFSLTPFIAVDTNGLAIAWFKGAVGFRITRK